MNETATKEAEKVLADALKDLESPKGSVQIGIQKLLRVSRLLDDDRVAVWCEIQLGNAKYTYPLQTAVNDYSVETVRLDQDIEQYIAELAKEGSSSGKEKTKATRRKSKTVEEKAKLDEYDEKLKRAKDHVVALDKLGLKEADHYPMEERRIKEPEAGGGYRNIGTIEEIYANLVRSKRGNDGRFYQVSLVEHINYVRRVAHSKATELYNRLIFATTPQTSLDVLRAEVDKKILHFAAQPGEKLIAAFQSVSSDNPEQWSHALTSCRRFLHELADILFPPCEGKVNGRNMNASNYISRLWAFMDESIASQSNRELAKAHLDYLGQYLERINKTSNKGVHSTLSRTEAIKAVFHTYLAVADVLDYLPEKT
jgi:hypothetical protein